VNASPPGPGEIRLVHTSDLHVTDEPDEPDGIAGLARVLRAAAALDAHLVLLAGDTFDSNRQGPAILERVAALLESAGRPVLILPGNHDPLTPDSVYRRGGIARLPNVCVLGVTHETAVEFPELALEVWGHAHRDYDTMEPLRQPRGRRTRWQVTMAHGHYEADGVPRQFPSWVFGDTEIEATAADYLALGHWNRAAKVGNGQVPAYYSGAPDFARSLYHVRLGASGVVVRREPLA
jgi:DNA repair exonuclease SbcCD nuclease subunit